MVAARREVFEGADADVARRDAGDDGPAETVTRDVFAGEHRRERARGRHAQRRHRLADDVLAEDGAERRAPVAPAREGRTPGPLQLHVAPLAVSADDLTEQDRAPVAELGHEVTELVTGVRERDGCRARRQRVAREDLRALGRSQRVGIEAEEVGERAVDLHDPRVLDLRRSDARVELSGQAPVAVVEGEHRRGPL